MLHISFGAVLWDFNRTILECKCNISTMKDQVIGAFNRTILECKWGLER